MKPILLKESLITDPKQGIRQRSYLEVDLRAISYNFDVLKKHAPDKNVLYMVKADAYGMGMNKIVEHCQKNKLCSSFGIASVDEFFGINWAADSEIFIFSETRISDYLELYQKESLHPVLSNLEDLALYLHHFPYKKLALKFNTGMNRLGLESTEAGEVARLLKQHKKGTIDYFISHLSSSYKHLSKSNTRQKSSFDKIKSELIDKGLSIANRSLSNSGGIENFDFDEEMMRPGILIQGITSSSTQRLKLRPVCRFLTYWFAGRFRKKGTPIGYGNSALPRDGFLAHIPVGYGDGLLSYYRGHQVRAGDTNGVIVGRVNMDLAAVLFDDKPNCSEVIIWDGDIAQVAKKLKASPYELLTNISKRVLRKYIN